MKNHNNCLSCKFYQRGKINFDAPNTPSTCTNNPDMFDEWWSTVQTFKSTDELPEVACFEIAEHLKPLDNMLRIVDEMLVVLKNKSENESTKG